MLGRHGGGDHYLGGRYRPPGAPPRSRGLAFPLSAKTVHLFEHLTTSQLREPVPPRRLFPVFSTRYQKTAFLFAQRVEASGGRSYNVEARPSEELDRHYAELHGAAVRADLAFFKRPTYEGYAAVAEAEERFGALRESLIEANLEHFAALGHDVVARLGRIHSRARRMAWRGFSVWTRIGTGGFFPEQVLKRRAIFGLEVREEDRLRGYLDRFLRIVPSWEWGVSLPPREFLLSLRGETLADAGRRFDAAAMTRASRSLPELGDLLRILREVTG